MEYLFADILNGSKTQGSIFRNDFRHWRRNNWSRFCAEWRKRSFPPGRGYGLRIRGFNSGRQSLEKRRTEPYNLQVFEFNRKDVIEGTGQKSVCRHRFYRMRSTRCDP